VLVFIFLFLFFCFNIERQRFIITKADHYELQRSCMVFGVVSLGRGQSSMLCIVVVVVSADNQTCAGQGQESAASGGQLSGSPS
jgi:hypothetical protein